MSAPDENTTTLGFTKTFLLPTLWVFLIPVLSLAFFWHAQATFDDRTRESILASIRADEEMTDDERARATEFFTRAPFSRLVTDPRFGEMLSDEGRFHYATFRWMIRLSFWSIIAGVAVYLLGGVCVLLSMRSQLWQLRSLAAGWQFLRVYSAAQAVVQGVLLVALSFWVTALWFEMYSVKLILVAGLLAVAAVFVVLKGIFKTPRVDNEVSGEVIEPSQPMPLWDELRRLCDRVGTPAPDQVIAGIDDNFFVTEAPITVGGRRCEGRTLFVSLSLLKQMNRDEADAVLAHEMAHFSGEDTLFSKRTAPLLARYENYLTALGEGLVTLPVYFFICGFRALFQVSLARVSRRREFRADRVAVEATSPEAAAGALLRITAYAKYRDTVQLDLFKQERALEIANIAERIEQGFAEYARLVASDPDLADASTAHPFDTHPPLGQRLEAVGVPVDSERAKRLLATPGDGGWFRHITEAQARERRQWDEFEEHFRKQHQASLAYRFLPSTPEEQAIVEQAFPAASFTGKDGAATLDFEKLSAPGWDDPIRFDEVTGMSLNDNQVLEVNFQRDRKQNRSIKLKKFASQQQELLETINHYYTRYLAAIEYKKQQTAEAADAP